MFFGFFGFFGILAKIGKNRYFRYMNEGKRVSSKIGIYRHFLEFLQKLVKIGIFGT